MPLQSLEALLDNKLLIAGSAILGGLATKLVEFYKRKGRVLYYTVTHTPVANAVDDAIFGSVQVTWQSKPMKNLYVSQVRLTNETGADLTDLVIRAFTNGTNLLSQKTEVAGSTFTLDFTDEYAAKLKVAEGALPSQEQIALFNSRREYKIPVLNRDQTIVLTYLTTSPNSQSELPAVFLDSNHAGLRLQFKAQVPSVLGVPLKTATYSGIGLALLILSLVLLFVPSPTVAGVICMAVGLVASMLGAIAVRTAKFFKSVVLH